MSEYHCLVAGLPDISFDANQLSFTVENFKSEIYPRLTADDAAKIDLFFYGWDNANIIKILKQGSDAELSRVGKFDAEQIAELIDAAKCGDGCPVSFPTYMYEFLVYYFENEGREDILFEDALAGRYYDYATRCGNSFLESWFTFNRNINNLQVAFLARKYKMNMSECIVGDDETSETIRNSASRDFGLAGTIDYLEQVLRLCESDKLQERERQMDELRWNWLEDNSIFNYFTIERIYVFLQKLDIVTRWTKLDTETGAKRYKELIDGLKSGLTINDEDYQ